MTENQLELAKDIAAAPDAKPSPSKRGLVPRLWVRVVELTAALFTFGVASWVFIITLSAAWFSGFIDALLPGTGGVVVVESPQIYTRERLVNDRFREQAWLDTQLAELADRAQLISSYRKSSIKVTAAAAAGPRPKDSVGEIQLAPDPSTAKETNADSESLESKLLVSADDSFNLQRNMRATIRRALIENELDDRHDLGSNSLYQFNFGAAIVAGARTRKIAGIEMEMEPDDPLRPIDQEISSPGQQCDGLRELECAFLIESGILDAKTEYEKELQGQFRRWKELFQKWIGYENAGYEREAGDIHELLGSPNAEARLKQLLTPFFNQLNAEGLRFIRGFNAVSRLPLASQNVSGRMSAFDCTFNFAKSKTSIESRISGFVHECASATNSRLLLLGSDDSGAKNYLRENRLVDASFFDAASDGGPNEKALFWDEYLKAATNYLGENRIVDALFFNSADDKEPNGKTRFWDQYFKYVFDQFNGECVWTTNLVKLVEANGEAGAHFQLADDVESHLLNCIEQSVIRDYGSHPFGRIKRDDGNAFSQFRGGDFGDRARVSAYQARQGLASVVVTGTQKGFRAQERDQYIGVVARGEEVANPKGLVLYPYDLETANETCAHHKRSGGTPGKIGKPTLGIIGAYSFSVLAPEVDRDIGWNFLTHLICSTYERRRGAAAGDNVDEDFHVPIGLFRFISLISNSQKTFSYSVQPSGVFDLQRRDSKSSWQFSSLFSNPGGGSQIASGGDTSKNWIEKQYRIIGYGAQVDGTADQDTKEQKSRLSDRYAKFGWYIFPGDTRGYIFGAPVMESANVKLSALISLPAWWESVNIIIRTKWLEGYSPDNWDGATNGAAEPQVLRVELPTRLEFIRNHFPNTASIRPSLYQLQLPQIALRACEEANVVLRGERLWRSTVVTLGSQKSSLIQVMPDMHGIIARFDKIVPAQEKSYSESITVWTSEGQKTVFDTADIQVPEAASERISRGESPCLDDPKGKEGQ